MTYIIKHKVQLNLLPKEEVLYIDRKHWISLVSSLLLHPLIILIISGLLLYLLYQHLPFIFPLVAFDFLLCILCLLAVLGTYLFLEWYFEFYVITNQRFIKIHFFHTTGIHYDEIFHLSDAKTEVSLVTNNVFYDMLNIEDVHVRFRSLARVEPFIFRTPSNSRKMEGVLEQISADRKERLL